MTTIDVYISGIEALKEIDKIANDFPCFVNYEPTTKEIEWEVTSSVDKRTLRQSKTDLLNGFER